MILSLSLRYSFSSKGQRARNIRLSLALSLSIAIFLLTFSVMNALQGERFEKIKEVRSFDIIAEGDRKEEISALYPDLTVFVYGEKDGIVNGSATKIRYIDESYSGGLNIARGDISSLLVPYDLWIKSPSGKVEIITLEEGRSGAVLPKVEEVTISGVYITSLGREFDNEYIFMPLSNENSADLYTAIIGRDDLKIESSKTWKESEASLYSAFIIEKTMMAVVLSFLFLIIIVSLNGNIKNFYVRKEKERAILEVLGLGRGKINFSFLLSFVLVLLLSFLLSLILFLLFRPIILSYIATLTYGITGLSFPMTLFISIAIFLLLLTLVLTTLLMRREGRKAIQEVIDGSGT